MNKYERYINYIVNDIELPYFKNMIEMYGLRPGEYKLVLSKVFNQPISIKGDYVYDTNGNQIYHETSYGFWVKREYDTNGNEIYRKGSTGSWVKKEYDNNGLEIYWENSDGYWIKKEYDNNGLEIYWENSYGDIVDNR